ncbi:hypothetical protein F2Q68_00018942 [Brassica cretica]|uniref:Uncharacterized protein n=1 Tax=Brassica cretica TaxID=69181 RepID=A0A8S9FPV6_BRACR|nr:hypothetical protein F2Q68_00018942 [Brassica cretica]
MRWRSLHDKVGRLENCDVEVQTSSTRITEGSSIAPSDPVETATKNNSVIRKLKQTLGNESERTSLPKRKVYDENDRKDRTE